MLRSPAVRLDLYLLRDKRGVAGPSVTMVKDGRKSGISYGGGSVSVLQSY